MKSLGTLELRITVPSRRAPQGARGLKSYSLLFLLPAPAVAPRKGRVG